MISCILQNEKYFMILKYHESKLLDLLDSNASSNRGELGGLQPKSTPVANSTVDTSGCNNSYTFDHMDLSIKIICSDDMLQEVHLMTSLSRNIMQTELLSHLNTKYQVAFVERDLKHPIKLVLDQQTGATIITSAIIRSMYTIAKFIA